MIVDRRCAIMISVLPLDNRAKASCTRTSLSGSAKAVASSKIRMDAFSALPARWKYAVPRRRIHTHLWLRSPYPRPPGILPEYRHTALRAMSAILLLLLPPVFQDAHFPKWTFSANENPEIRTKPCSSALFLQSLLPERFRYGVRLLKHHGNVRSGLPVWIFRFLKVQPVPHDFPPESSC